MNGVLNPVIALKIDENHYQLISGHRRKRACILLGIDRIPLIGRDMNKLAQDRGLPRYCFGMSAPSAETRKTKRLIHPVRRRQRQRLRPVRLAAM